MENFNFCFCKIYLAGFKYFFSLTPFDSQSYTKLPKAVLLQVTHGIFTPTCLHVTGYIINLFKLAHFFLLLEQHGLLRYELLSTCVFVELANIYIF